VTRLGTVRLAFQADSAPSRYSHPSKGVRTPSPLKVSTPDSALPQLFDFDAGFDAGLSALVRGFASET